MTSAAPSPPGSPNTALARRLADGMPYVLGFGAVLLLVVMLAGVSIWQERVREHERAAAATHNLARLLEAHVADALTQADVVLAAAAAAAATAAPAPAAQARDAVSRDPADVPAPVLRALAAAAPELLNLRLADAEGRWRPRPGAAAGGPAGAAAGGPSGAATGTAAEREEFRRARAGPAAGLIVTGPLRHDPDAPWVLVLSRGIVGAGGRFAGLVSVDLPVTRFDALFAAIDLGDDGDATIRTDGLALVYRRPWPRGGPAAVGGVEVSAALREAIATNPLAGEFEAATALDGSRRINTYRKVGGYPLLLLVGLPKDDFVRGWNAVDATILALATATLVAAALAALSLRRAGRRALDSARQRLAAIVDSSQDAIASETVDGVITSWNPGAERMYGHAATEMLGQSLQRVVPPDRREALGEVLARVHHGERVAHFDTEQLCRDGRRIAVSMSISPVVDADGRIVGVSRIARDITQQKAMAEELRQLAFQDALTHLPNRRLLLDRLLHAQQASRRLGSHGAVLLLDLDRFKQLNDRLGHEAGDQLLVAVARRLQAAVRETDTVARLGGDEFVLVCEHLGADPAEAAVRVAALEAKIIEAVSRPVLLAGQSVRCEASIGHRLFFGSHDELDRLIADADQAMYRHKQQRRPPPVDDDPDPDGDAYDD